MEGQTSIACLPPYYYSIFNARKDDHETLADVAPAGRQQSFGSIQRVGEANLQSSIPWVLRYTESLAR